jgi:hypothetical protein
LEAIPEVIRKFIADHIHSVVVLEILLLLRAEPQKEWGALAVSNALRLDRITAQSRLEELRSADLVSSRYIGTEGVFRYKPGLPEQLHAVNELARLYSSHRVALTTVIYSNPDDQIRTYPATSNE